MAAFINRLSASLCLVHLVLAAVPNPHELDSDLTILTHNDLYGNSSDRQTSVIVVSKCQSQAAASLSCAALGESLWSHERLQEELGFLKYLDYADQGEQVYWVASTAHTKCRAITPEGHTLELPCDTPLPALCQSW